MSAPDTSTAAVQALLDGVTPGPWVIKFRPDGSSYISMGGTLPGQAHKQFDCGFERGEDEDDAAFIAAARDLVPALLAERDALRAELATARDDALDEAAKSLDWRVNRLSDVIAQGGSVLYLQSLNGGKIELHNAAANIRALKGAKP